MLELEDFLNAQNKTLNNKNKSEKNKNLTHNQHINKIDNENVHHQN